MNRIHIILLLTAALMAMLAMPAGAHRVSIYAYAAGDTVYTESGFSKSKPVVNGVVQVFDAAGGELLLTGQTDAEGMFHFAIPPKAREERVDLKLVVQAGEGHTGEWLLMAEEYLLGGDGAPGAGSVASAPPETGADAETGSPQSSHIPAPTQNQLPTPDADLQAAVQQALSESLGPALDAALEPRLAPMRRSLAAMENPDPGLRDIVGGLGWIVGLAGAFALGRSRKHKG